MNFQYNRNISKDISRMKKIKSFKFESAISTPVVQFIPTQELPRDTLYREFELDGVTLPPYAQFKRRALRKRDMMVLCEPISIRFRYMGKSYEMNFKKGYCFDGASVPTMFVFGNVSKFNQYVLFAAMVHDALFALQLLGDDKLGFEDANNIFSAILRYQRINKFALLRYMLGVRSFVGWRLYKKSNPETSWLLDFVSFEVID